MAGARPCRWIRGTLATVTQQYHKDFENLRAGAESVRNQHG
jgi:hypothetical protein